MTKKVKNPPKSPIFSYKDPSGSPILTISYLPEGGSVFTIYNFVDLPSHDRERIIYPGIRGWEMPKSITGDEPKHCFLHDNIALAKRSNKLQHKHFEISRTITATELKELFSSLRHTRLSNQAKQKLFQDFFSDEAYAQQLPRFQQFLKQSRTVMPLSFYASPNCPGWDTLPGVDQGNYTLAASWLNQYAGIDSGIQQNELALFLHNNAPTNYASLAGNVFLALFAGFFVIYRLLQVVARVNNNTNPTAPTPLASTEVSHTSRHKQNQIIQGSHIRRSVPPAPAAKTVATPP